MPQDVLANAIDAVARILSGILNLYMWIVIISALLSWVNPDPRNPIVRFLYSVTEPVLYWLRRRVPFLIVGNLDLSPIALILGIQFLQLVLVRSLFDLAAHVRPAGSFRLE